MARAGILEKWKDGMLEQQDKKAKVSTVIETF
jgi:hypothetical protein